MTTLKKATLRGQKRRQAIAKQGSLREALRLSKKVTLAVSFLADLNNFDKLSDRVEKAAGVSADDSGFGFGGRDLQFRFKTVQEAQAAADRILALKLTGLTADIDGVGVY